MTNSSASGSLKKEKLAWKKGSFIRIRDTRSWLEVLWKKIGTYLVYVLAFVFIMLAFACGTIAFAELGYSAVLGFTFGYSFALLSMYLIFILHELGHAFCGYLTGYRLVAFGLGHFLLTKKSGRFYLSRTAVLKMLVLSTLDWKKMKVIKESSWCFQEAWWSISAWYYWRYCLDFWQEAGILLVLGFFWIYLLPKTTLCQSHHRWSKNLGIATTSWKYENTPTWYWDILPRPC